jgi:hypothetical protein
MATSLLFTGRRIGFVGGQDRLTISLFAKNTLNFLEIKQVVRGNGSQPRVRGSREGAATKSSGQEADGTTYLSSMRLSTSLELGYSADEEEVAAPPFRPPSRHPGPPEERSPATEEALWTGRPAP